jgi:hypothetical protein
MTASAAAEWQPSELVRVEAVRETSMRVVLAVTNCGKAYIKPLGGSRYGNHCLACEWVGTRLADWFGLPTLEYALMNLTALDAEMIREAGGGAQPGWAFVTRAEERASPWSGGIEELARLVNADAIPRLVVFDTWTLNWDRYPPRGHRREPNYDNVLLVKDLGESGRLRLIAIDHGECFSIAQELTARVAGIDRIQEDRVFGMFPAFSQFMRQDAVADCAAKLRLVRADEVRDIVHAVPDGCDVPGAAKNALIDLVCGRAAYLADRIEGMLRHANGELF